MKTALFDTSTFNQDDSADWSTWGDEKIAVARGSGDTNRPRSRMYKGLLVAGLALASVGAGAKYVATEFGDAWNDAGKSIAEQRAVVEDRQVRARLCAHLLLEQEEGTINSRQQEILERCPPPMVASADASPLSVIGR